jgi:hypothetical protein
LVDDTEPQAPFSHPVDSDNDNTIIIQASEPPANEKVDSPSVKAPEEPTLFAMAMSEKPVTLIESTQEDANEVADTAISEITKVCEYNDTLLTRRFLTINCRSRYQP